MPLIDLKTDLKSLRYGNDRINGGSSNQPYITKGIPEGYSSLGAFDNDFLLRGGITAVSESGKDVLRLGKMFTDLRSPNGLLFTIKQNLLSQNAVRTQASTEPQNNGVYSPLNTLAQAGVNAFGIHFNKQGKTPTSLVFYSDVVKTAQPTDENRLFDLYSKKISVKTDSPNILSYDGGPGAILGVGTTYIKFADQQRTGINNPWYKPYSDYKVKSVLDGKLQGGLKINTDQPWNASKYELPLNNVNTPQYDPESPLQPTISGSYNVVIGKGVSDQYLKAFPNSKIFGDDFNDVGKTLWNNSVYNSGSSFPDSSNPANFDNGTITYSQKQLYNANPASQGGLVGDFRQVIRASLRSKESPTALTSGQLTEAPSYTTKNIETRVHLGDPGNRIGKSYASYTKGPIDKVTGKSTGPLDVINASAVGANPKTLNDLITFNIIPLDGNTDDTFINAMTFRAFLGSISDSYSSEVNSHKFVGRGENFYTYGGFDRKISLSWTVAAQSKAELIPMYKKLSYLASNLAPIYKGGFMQGPLVQLTVGGYLHKMPGYITNLNYELSEDTTWEIQIDTEGNPDREVSELPHMIKVTGFNFIPIPHYLPEVGARFIDLWNGQKYL